MKIVETNVDDVVPAEGLEVLEQSDVVQIMKWEDLFGINLIQSVVDYVLSKMI